MIECPVCQGTEASVVQEECGIFYVHCECGVDGPWAKTKGNAERWWNLRCKGGECHFCAGELFPVKGRKICRGCAAEFKGVRP